MLDQTGSSDHTFSYQPDRYHLVPKLLLLLSHITPHSYTFSRSVLASQTRSNEGLTHTTSHIFSHQISFSSLPLKHASSIFTTHTHIHNVSASIKLSQALTILSLSLLQSNTISVFVPPTQTRPSLPSSIALLSFVVSCSTSHSINA